MENVSVLHYGTERFEEIKENYEKLRELEAFCHLLTQREKEWRKRTSRKRKKTSKEMKEDKDGFRFIKTLESVPITEQTILFLEGLPYLLYLASVYLVHTFKKVLLSCTFFDTIYLEELVYILSSLTNLLKKE